ncbi:DUF1007 family protein [Aidingimonas halophila]|uniref:ABC-type uncharacterized transport system, substrate-binding protein n=1 Tax=Aidingimonas halophila TaxID=574349 RepID=A0A1H2U8K2_9GAMM|nr:DUF1007 family protein [Aidingimonas halophila]GHC22296.1 ABC transporter substrate-binding protein [Aidingimonas halophila]SDW52267.1 ABC-type uncharacterized transport system, substrate-binding protein [Aidingimonas halophila]
MVNLVRRIVTRGRDLAIAITLFMIPLSAAAHPHGWVDLQVSVILDEQGRVEALQQRWRLDPFYSLILLEELGRADSDASMDARLDQLGTEIRDNLDSQGYFTEIAHAGESVPSGRVEEYTTMARGERVEFTFRLPLASPLSLEDQPLQYRIYDPTYYIEIVHDADDEGREDEALSVTGNDCTTRIIPADPDPERVAEAARLDQTDDAPDGLGRFFAETGEVQCAP